MNKIVKNIKFIVRILLPPIILTLYYKLTKRDKPRTFKGVYKNFDDIPAADIGSYDSEKSLADIYNRAFSQIEICNNRVNLPKAHERSQVTNLLPLVISLFKKEQVSILDYGGGAGETFVDCVNKINMSGVKFYIHDLDQTMDIGKKLFGNFQFDQDSSIKFINDVSEVDKFDIVYFGSSLQYLSNYRDVVESILCKKPKYVFLTDNFFSRGDSYATVQINMTERKMAYWIFSFDEILSILTGNNYNLIYKSTNFQPFHASSSNDQFSDSLNLLFERGQ
jgi:putative methyltransferase (TIGR04325 family)